MHLGQVSGVARGWMDGFHLKLLGHGRSQRFGSGF